jgi:3'-phosphoadenosine 5'-phosphosulfate sulfotransferase (PAPS reductase)/FAD synthetase
MIPGDYDKIVIFFSGGKDSLACLLHLLDSGADPAKIELWHHDIDGQGGHFMDWPVTKAYCSAVARTLGIQLYFSWRQGGFYREMMRENQRTAPTYFETPSGTIESAGGKAGKYGTRRQFPQVSADLSQRWCSAYLKIDVADLAIRNQERFRTLKTLTVSGERAEESSARSRYQTYEPDRTHSAGRTVYRWRPVHKFTEQQIWEIIARHRINPHPAYHLGYGRTSCLHCIFGNGNQWASSRAICPAGFSRIASLETEFGKTIHRKKSVIDLADSGNPYSAITPDLVDIGMSESYTEPVILDKWFLPAGAFGESNGPS